MTGRFDRSAYKALGLTEAQLNYLQELIPFARAVQAQTLEKAWGRTYHGVFASVVLAISIYRTDWGKHPLSQPKLKIKGKSCRGNNLAAIHADERFCKIKRPVEIDDILFKTYSDRNACAIDLSDIFSWKYRYDYALASKTPEDQLKVLSHRANDPARFLAATTQLLDQFRLRQYDG